MLSGSVHCSTRFVSFSRTDLIFELTVFAQEIYKTKISVSNSHEKYLCGIVRPATVSANRIILIQDYILNVVVPDVRCQFPGLEGPCFRII
jgi:hypothetical protein